MPGPQIEREQASVAARISAAVPGLAHPLALPAGAERARRRRARRRGGPDRGDSRRARGAAERPLPPHALPEPAGDRRAAGLGPDARDRGRRDQDRRDRRRRRPDASVLLAGRLLDARRLPEGQRGLHDGEGDRRALVPAPGRQLALREAALRPAGVGARHARGRDRGRRPRHDRAGAGGHGAGLGDRAARVHRQLPDRDDPDERPRARRQLARDRGGDRAGSPRRHERDQPLVRRAGDHAVARHRRAGDRTPPPTPASCR